jgi:Flp pilus assembly protein TadG
MLLNKGIGFGRTSPGRERVLLACAACKSRCAAALVEFAIVGALTFILIVGLMVGGLGVYRYNLVATMAREASRQASVHGTQYAKDTGNKAWTDSDVYNNVIAPLAVALDTSKLNYQVTWNTSNSPYRTLVVNNQLVAVNNTVTVIVTYQWISEAYFGTVNLTSTSVTPMTY